MQRASADQAGFLGIAAKAAKTGSTFPATFGPANWHFSLAVGSTFPARCQRVHLLAGMPSKPSSLGEPSIIITTSSADTFGPNKLSLLQVMRCLISGANLHRATHQARLYLSLSNSDMQLGPQLSCKHKQPRCSQRSLCIARPEWPDTLSPRQPDRQLYGPASLSEASLSELSQILIHSQVLGTGNLLRPQACLHVFCCPNTPTSQNN